MDQFENEANRSYSPQRPGTYKVSPHLLSPADSIMKESKHGGSKHRLGKKNNS